MFDFRCNVFLLFKCAYVLCLVNHAMLRWNVMESINSKHCHGEFNIHTYIYLFNYIYMCIHISNPQCLLANVRGVQPWWSTLSIDVCPSSLVWSSFWGRSNYVFFGEPWLKVHCTRNISFQATKATFFFPEGVSIHEPPWTIGKHCFIFHPGQAERKQVHQVQRGDQNGNLNEVRNRGIYSTLTSWGHWLSGPKMVAFWPPKPVA